MTEQDDHEADRHVEEPSPEDLPDEPGAEGGSKSPAADQPPGAPARDETPVGDTDQHSTG